MELYSIVNSFSPLPPVIVAAAFSAKMVEREKALAFSSLGVFKGAKFPCARPPQAGVVRERR